MRAPVTENRDLGESWYLMELEAPELAQQCRAGQFVQVRIGEGDDPMLRRPFSVFEVAPERNSVGLLYQVVGPGTRWMQQRGLGDPVDLLGPLGNPFPQLEPDPGGEIFLVGGGIGVAPLYFYAREQQAAGSPVAFRVLIGARRKSLLVSLPWFEEHDIPVQVATDDGSAGHHGNVVELLDGATRDLARGQVVGIGCGPHGMNLALRDYAVSRDLNFWISLDNYMPCGFGACYSCVIPAPEGSVPAYRRVCVEGPAFPATEIPTGA